MAGPRPCLRCGVPTLNGSRCLDCNRGLQRAAHNPAYDRSDWRELRTQVLADWRGRHGDWCPGFGRAGHASSDLTVDHVTSLANGGALLGPTQVLCRGCNTRKRWADSPSRRSRAAR